LAKLLSLGSIDGCSQIHMIRSVLLKAKIYSRYFFFFFFSC